MIGSRGEELDETQEEVRLEMLISGAEHEAAIEAARASMFFFGPLEQGDTGKIRAGTLTQTRRESYYDFLEQLMPWIDFSQYRKPSEGSSGGTPEGEQKDREEFLSLYKDWTKNNGPVEASRLQYSKA